MAGTHLNNCCIYFAIPHRDFSGALVAVLQQRAGAKEEKKKNIQFNASQMLFLWPRTVQ